MLVKFVLSCALLAIAFANTTNVQVCTANSGELPINTYVEGCDQPPCRLPQERNAVINVQFKALRAIQTMRTLATAYLSLGIITVPIPYDLGPDSVTCDSLTNAACPIEAGQIVDYKLNMYIESFFLVGTSVSVEFRVVDEANQPVWCIRLPITIVAPSAVKVAS